jgi:hypothetical protein
VADPNTPLGATELAYDASGDLVFAGGGSGMALIDPVAGTVVLTEQVPDATFIPAGGLGRGGTPWCMIRAPTA